MGEEDKESKSQPISRRRFLKAVVGSAAGIAFSQALPESAPTKVEAQSFIPSETIDGVETFGHAQPLNQESLNSLIQELNSSPREMKPDTYYGTFFITQALYQQYLKQYSESFQTCLARNYEKMSCLLKEVDAATAGGFSLRRLVVLDGIMDYPASYHLGYLENGIHDSDGTFFLKDSYPLSGAYYDPQEKIDYALLHETGHTIFHLNDQYLMDIPSQGLPESLREQLPNQWWEYRNEFRVGLSDCDLMSRVYSSSFSTQIQEWTACLLKRRQSSIHDFSRWFKDYQGWPAEFTPNLKLVFTKDNKPLSVDSFKVYRSKKNDQGNKIISDIPVWTGRPENLDPSSLFSLNQDGVTAEQQTGLTAEQQAGLIPDDEATLLFMIDDKDGSKNFRWMDVRDFNLACWKQANTMTVKVPSSQEDPISFDWKINYEKIPEEPPKPPSVGKTFLPVISR